MAASSDNTETSTGTKLNVGLLVTCLVDLFRPSVGFAAVKLLEDAGCRVHVPEQTCCGQPAYNAGARDQAQALARRIINEFEAYDYVVAPSGSCAGMAAMHYPELFHGDPVWARRARDLARRTFELTSFLTDVLKVDAVGSVCNTTATYHDSCAGLREMNVRNQPRKLLAGVEGLELTELPGAEVCCGFGGTFCVKYDEISLDIVGRKIDDVIKTGADTLLAGDLGCLLNMAGALKRRGSSIEVRHVAEVLAGISDGVPSIGEEDDREG
jgi:L-lactate dehydrogenase complex protein LldE